MTTPALPAAPFHPTTTPCSLEKMKLAGEAPAKNEVVSLAMTPDGAPGPNALAPHCCAGAAEPVGPGTPTTSAEGTPFPL